MENSKKNLFSGAVVLVAGVMLAMMVNGCNKPNATSPILPGNEQLTTTFLIYTDAADTAVHDTAFRSQYPPQFTDTANPYFIWQPAIRIPCAS